MQRFLLLGALCLSMATAAAQTNAKAPPVEISYGYLQGGYQEVSLDNGPDGDGFGIGGSFEFSDSVYAFASYGTASFDFGVDLDELAIGAGYHTRITGSTDVFAALAYIVADADSNAFGSLDENGFGATIGVRGMLSPKLELAASIGYVDLGNGADGTSLGGAAWYSLGSKLALGINADFAENGESFGVGVRWYFDK
jgi:hypothetical protein